MRQDAAGGVLQTQCGIFVFHRSEECLVGRTPGTFPTKILYYWPHYCLSGALKIIPFYLEVSRHKITLTEMRCARAVLHGRVGILSDGHQHFGRKYRRQLHFCFEGGDSTFLGNAGNHIYGASRHRNSDNSDIQYTYSRQDM